MAWLASAASDRPQAVALSDETGRLSYGELWQALGGWRHAFSGAGLQPGAPLAVISRHRRRIARAAWLAVYCGLPLLPVSPSQPGLAGLLRCCAVHQAIADADTSLPDGVSRLPADWLDCLPGGSIAAPEALAGNRPQFLVGSSGTEGPPRAAMLSVDNLASSAAASCEFLGMEANDNWLLCLPLTHIAGLMILFRCARAGAAVSIHEAFDADAVWTGVSSGRVTRLSLVPPMLARLLEVSDDKPGAHGRSLIVGGAPVAPVMAERAVETGWPILTSYGMTETASHVALGGPNPEDGLRVLPGTRIELADDNGEAVSGRGRILVSGPTVMLGYANAGLLPGEGLLETGRYLTGDVGEIDDQGRLRIAGRCDDVLISGGVNVHPAASEALLAACPGVIEAGIAGRPDPEWGQRLVAVYVGDTGPDELRRWAGKHIAPALRPREFIRVPELPRNQLGKLDRRQLGLLAGSLPQDEC
jgi:O-succinylbenzoic acid--CoA ligase